MRQAVRAQAKILVLCAAGAVSGTALAERVPVTFDDALLNAGFHDDGSEVCVGTKYFNAQGEILTGSKACSPGDVTACKKDGAVNCKTGVTFPAASVATATQENIKAGVKIVGVTGVLATNMAACTADGQAGCLATASLPAIDVAALLTAGVLKKGVTIAGVTGGYPSATYPLAGSLAGVVDLLAGDLDSQLRSTATFEWFDRDGNRYTKTGDADLANPAAIRDGVVLFGTVGSLVASSGSCTDAGQVGCTTTAIYRSTKNFRNGANTALIDITTGPAGAGLDRFDTIDDHQNNAAGIPTQNPWGFNALASASYFTDMTPDGTCDTLGDDCVYRDKVTGQDWSESRATLDFSTVPGANWPCGAAGCTQFEGNITAGGGSGAYGSGANLRWFDAIYACEQLVHGGQSDWRLPTKSELTMAITHGLNAVAGPLTFANSYNALLWTSTTTPFYFDGDIAIVVAMDGNNQNGNKATATWPEFLCVRN